MFVHKKVKYNPYSKSVPVPIIGHTNEVVIPVSLAKKMHGKLQKYDPFTRPIYNRLRFLFGHTVVRR